MIINRTDVKNRENEINVFWKVILRPTYPFPAVKGKRRLYLPGKETRKDKQGGSEGGV